MPWTTHARRNGFLYALAACALLGAASFVFVFSYFSDRAVASAQTAAATAAVYNPFDTVSLEAQAAIVIDLTTGETLYARHADAQLALASLTKVALVLAVSEVLHPDQKIHIPQDMPRYDSLHELPPGETWTVRDMLHFTLLTSSNQGAELLAEAAGAQLVAHYPGSTPREATVARMNAIATATGLTSTYFLNPHGLDQSEHQSGAYGSARDMAKLFAYAATQPGLFDATAKDGLLLFSETGGATSAQNTNASLGRTPGLILGKTGYTDLAGGNLAIVFDVGLAHPVAAVVLGSSRDGRFTDMETLIRATRASITGI